MKRLFALFLVLLTSVSLGIGTRGWAKDKPQTADQPGASDKDAVGATASADDTDSDDPSAVSVSDLELIGKKISDLAKYAKVSLLIQGQYTNASPFGTVAPGIKGPTAPAAAGFKNVYDQFSVKRTEIGLFGEVIPGLISYQVKFDPAAQAPAAVPAFTSITGTAVTLTTPAIAKPGVSNGEQLKDYYVKVAYIPYADLQFGQYKYPQALEGRTPSGELDFVNTALVTTALEARRDLAFQASASKVAIGPVNIDYALAVVSGAGQNIADTNENKDAALRGGVDWTGLGLTGLWTGFSAYGGWEQDALTSVTTSKTSTVFAPSGERSDTGLELRWVYNGFKLQGEYIQGKLEPGNFYNPSTTRESWPQGYYLTAQYRAGDVRFGVRGESYIANVYNGAAHWNNDVLTAGIDWFQAKDRFKFSINAEDHFKQYQAILGQAEINL